MRAAEISNCSVGKFLSSFLLLLLVFPNMGLLSEREIASESFVNVKGMARGPMRVRKKNRGRVRGVISKRHGKERKESESESESGSM